MAGHPCKNDDVEPLYRYGAITQSPAGFEGSVPIKGDQRCPTGDGQDYDDDDNGYTRFVRPSNANWKFFADRQTQDRLRVIINIVVNVTEW
jgi:hypothetical protein